MMDNVEKEAQANGTDLNTYLSNYGYDLDTFKTQVKEGAESYIREKMILSAIALEEGITATDEEVDAKVDELLKARGIADKETLKSTYGYEDEDFFFTVLEEKVTNFIFENAVAVEATETDAEEETEPTEMVDDYGTTEEEKKEED